MTKATGRFKDADVAAVPTELVALYAAKGRTITRAQTRGEREGLQWRITTDSGLTAEWTWQNHQGQPWKVKVKR